MADVLFHRYGELDGPRRSYEERGLHLGGQGCRVGVSDGGARRQVLFLCDDDEFDRVKDSFVLDLRRMSLAKKKMAVLHPLPRVNEILTEVDSEIGRAHV